MIFGIIRTMNNQHNPFADGGRYSVWCDAQIRPHVQPIYFCDFKKRALHTQGCNQQMCIIGLFTNTQSSITTHYAYRYDSMKLICKFLKPSLPFPRTIVCPSSLLQVILGVGEPVAAHLKVTLLPSRTTISVLVW